MGKSLSLILALVFVLGLCTVGSNAAFSDEADVTDDYKDAIKVLTGLQIIEGYKDGTFGPEKNVTRAEAAAMIARMMLGREAADKLPVGEVKFSDVPETHWAVQYIAFCANKGIIVGMGNGTFCPNDNVTGTQLAAMLLRALGYDAMGEYQGKGWDINAVADALYYGVFKESLVVDFSKPATREETAQYIWNTLWLTIVGYDVDKNFYDEKQRRVKREDGLYEYIDITFADDMFNLRKFGYDSKTNPATYIVLGNAATGDPYTMVGQFYDYVETIDGNKVRVTGFGVNFYVDWDYGEEDPLDYIGHEVTVYLDADTQTDTTEHLDYYKCYLLKDESTILNQGAKLDDFYRAAKNANQKNLDLRFADIPGMTNHDYKQNTWYDTIANFGYHLGYITDADDGYKYYQISAVRGQKSSGDSAPSGTWILDHAGMVLLVLTDDYRVAKVTEVDTANEEVELDIWLDDDRFYQDGGYPMKYDDVDLVYDGVAKGDYAQVLQQGKLFFVKPTTTKTVDVTDISKGFFGPTFNSAFFYDFWGYGIPIVDKDEHGDVSVGDKVKFYVIEGPYGDNYFGLQIIEKAKSEGLVYINMAEEFIGHGDWDEDVDELGYVWKVQGINQDGEEVVYTFSQKKWKDLKIQPKPGFVYEVRKQGNSYFFDNSDKALKYVTKLTNNGTSSYLTNEWTEKDPVTGEINEYSDIYYTSKDTKVIYFSGYKDELEITVASKLAKGDKPYEVWVLAKPSGSTKKLISVWVDNNKAEVEVPTDYPTEGYMYVANKKNGGTSSSGSTLHNEEPHDKYSVYIDGDKKTVFLTGDGDEDIFVKDDIVRYGFYKYRDADEDGVFELTAVAKGKAHYGVVLGKNGDGNIDFDDKLIAMGSEGADLKGIKFVDISGGTTIKTKTDANVIELSVLKDYLSQGYQITVDYMYNEDKEGNEYPFGVMYVTEVTVPEGTERVK